MSRRALAPDCQAFDGPLFEGHAGCAVGGIGADYRHHQIQLRAGSMNETDTSQDAVALSVAGKAIDVDRGSIRALGKQFLFAHSETLQKIRNHAPQKPDSKESPTLNCKFLVMEHSTPARTPHTKVGVLPAQHGVPFQIYFDRAGINP